MEYKEIFTSIYDNNGFGSLESKSGPGSTLDETQKLREKIKSIVKDKNIKSVVDIPCGDFNWMKEIVFNFDSYIGGDIVEKAIEENNKRYSNSVIKFISFDIVNDEIPQGDLLIVRDIIGHFPIEDGIKIINNILNSKCKYLLSTTWAKKIGNDWFPCEKNDVHRENEGVDYGRFYPVNLMSEPFNLPNAEIYLEEDVVVHNFENGNRKTLALWDLDKIKNANSKLVDIDAIGRLDAEICSEINNLDSSTTTYKSNLIVDIDAATMPVSDLTVVTGLWNINRVGRPFDSYIENLNKFLDIDANLFLYLPKELEPLVWQKRSRKNTFVKIYELEDVKNMYKPFWDNTQKLRNDPTWANKAGWLAASPQASLEWYNPIVQSKMFLLNDVTIWNPFNTKHFMWLDAGITSTVYEKYFTDNRALDKITPYLEQFLFLSYPYEANAEIHGFDFNAINRYSGKKLQYVCRGGLFGGTRESINQANSTYYALLNTTLNSGYMGTEESVFTIMSYLEPEKYRRYSLDENGLIVKFMQALLDNKVELEPVPKDVNIYTPRKFVNPDKLKLSIYMLTFNFPHQLEHTIQTWLQHPKWITNTKNILIDNSTNEDARIANAELCKKYKFEHIINNKNDGINGGRLKAAQHFQESDSDYYVFLEDDMGLHPPGHDFCRNGFRTYVPDLYDKVLKIMGGGVDVDFLKFSYTEVYMDNNIQVSWYNVPNVVRSDVWPNYNKLPVSGLDPNCPRTKFDTIEVVDGLSYIKGDVYYANWPMIVGKSGNKKMFLDTTWSYPYEQTWMSYMFQETKKGNLKPAILLASPINHNRIAHYSSGERKENAG